MVDFYNIVREAINVQVSGEEIYEEVCFFVGFRDDNQCYISIW